MAAFTVVFFVALVTAVILLCREQRVSRETAEVFVLLMRGAVRIFLALQTAEKRCARAEAEVAALKKELARLLAEAPASYSKRRTGTATVLEMRLPLPEVVSTKSPRVKELRQRVRELRNAGSIPRDLICGDQIGFLKKAEAIALLGRFDPLKAAA